MKKIFGTTVGTTLPKPSWKQANPKKGDYIKDKPTEMEVVRGYSAYQVAVMNGFSGTEQEWLASLVGPRGKDGDALTEAEKEEIIREVNTEVMQEVVKEESVTVITNEVLKQMNSMLAGKWVMNNVDNASPGEYIQEVNFTSKVSLYQLDDGSLGTIGNKNQLVSTHEVMCSEIELKFNEAMPVIIYTVESTDETLQAFIDQNGSNRLMVFSMFLTTKMWSHSDSKIVDFGQAQNVSAEFKEVFEVIATQKTEGTVTNIDFSNFDKGSFTEVVDGKEITHSVTFDDSGNPTKIDGVTIVWG